MLFGSREKVLNVSKSELFPLEPAEGIGYKVRVSNHLSILTSKQMLRKLSIVIAQVQAVNTSETY